MKIKYLTYSILLFCLLINSGSVFSADYRLGAGDTISVMVFNEEDMSVPRIRIPKKGRVTFPYIGELKVKGLTLEKLKVKLIKKLKNGYLKKPQLVINIVEYRPFFVNGQVKSPGGYPYVEGLTVRKAIAISGGLTDRASLKSISIVAESSTKASKVGRSLDVLMNPGDVLTIGESLF